MMRLASSILLLLCLTPGSDAFIPLNRNFRNAIHATRLRSTTDEVTTDETTTTKNQNVLQTENTSRSNIMTFSYDMSLEPTYEKPTYPGTGNGLSGEPGEYDVVVIGSGMGGLTCGALRYDSRNNVQISILFCFSND